MKKKERWSARRRFLDLVAMSLPFPRISLARPAVVRSVHILHDPSGESRGKEARSAAEQPQSAVCPDCVQTSRILFVLDGEIMSS